MAMEEGLPYCGRGLRRLEKNKSVSGFLQYPEKKASNAFSPHRSAVLRARCIEGPLPTAPRSQPLSPRWGPLTHVQILYLELTVEPFSQRWFQKRLLVVW